MTVSQRRDGSPSPGTDPTALVDWAVVTRRLEGEQVCGDLSLVQVEGERALVAVVDGLGHGIEAARAAELALHVVRRHAGDDVLSLFEHCHEALADTRGVVMSIAVFDGREHTLTWAGVGDVEGVLLGIDPRAADEPEYLLRRAGVVGSPEDLRVRADILRLTPGATLVLATDGVRSGFERGVVLRDSPAQIAEQLMAEHASKLDDSLVLVARYLGLGDLTPAANANLARVPRGPRGPRGSEKDDER